MFACPKIYGLILYFSHFVRQIFYQLIFRDPYFIEDVDSSQSRCSSGNEEPAEEVNGCLDSLVLKPKEANFSYEICGLKIWGGIKLRGKIDGLADLIATKHSYYVTSEDFSTSVEFKVGKINICYEALVKIFNMEAEITFSPILKNATFLIDFEETPAGKVKCNLNNVNIESLNITAKVSGLNGVLCWPINLILNLTLKSMSFVVLCLSERLIKKYLNPLQPEYSASNIYFPISFRDVEKPCSHKKFRRVLKEYLKVSGSNLNVKFSKELPLDTECRGCFFDNEYYMSIIFIGNLFLNLRGVKNTDKSCETEQSTNALKLKIFSIPPGTFDHTCSRNQNSETELKSSHSSGKVSPSTTGNEGNSQSSEKHSQNQMLKSDEYQDSCPEDANSLHENGMNKNDSTSENVGPDSELFSMKYSKIENDQSLQNGS